HCGVDTATALDRRKRTSIPEMAGYELQGSRILRKQLGCALGAILMVDPMKPITTNPLPEPFVRTRIHSRCLWQATVKAGVEDCQERELGPGLEHRATEPWLPDAGQGWSPG